MPLRPMRVHLLLSSVFAASLLLASCSSKDLQDVNINTDVAAGWLPPDSGSKDTSSEAGAGEAGSSQAEVDDAAGAGSDQAEVGDAADAGSDQAEVSNVDVESVDGGSSDDGPADAPSAADG